MEYITLNDTDILAVNRGMHANEAGSIVYRGMHNTLHTIDFAACAANYKAIHSSATGNCIGERKVDEFFFIFYTSGIRTKVTFNNRYVADVFHRRLLRGSRTQRFLALQKLIAEARCTTYDLS